jgi:hypothetical protein
MHVSQVWCPLLPYTMSIRMSGSRVCAMRVHETTLVESILSLAHLHIRRVLGPS